MLDRAVAGCVHRIGEYFVNWCLIDGSTPGHTLGHCALHLPERDVVISADALVTYAETAGFLGLGHERRRHILWCWIDMQDDG